VKCPISSELMLSASQPSLLLIAGSGIGMADTISTGTAGQISWIDTQDFNLDGTFPMICYSASRAGGCSNQTQQTTFLDQSIMLSFHGTPTGFTIAGTQYSLTG
jgi:hypothetical protein